MAKRVCAKCGNEKEISGGLICEKGHFICRACSGKDKGFVVDYTLKKCPVCSTKLS